MRHRSRAPLRCRPGQRVPLKLSTWSRLAALARFTLARHGHILGPFSWFDGAARWPPEDLAHHERGYEARCLGCAVLVRIQSTGHGMVRLGYPLHMIDGCPRPMVRRRALR